MKPQKQSAIDGRGLVWGLVLGTLVGGLGALFKAPLLRAGVPKRRESIAATRGNTTVKAAIGVPADPVAESRAQGKAAARRRRSEMGV